jgi:hypothetical protein
VKSDPNSFEEVTAWSDGHDALASAKTDST